MASAIDDVAAIIKRQDIEIVNLRAELAAKDTRIGELDSALLSHMDDWAEETIVSLRAELDTANLKLDEFQHKIWKLEPAARHAAEEIARLKWALEFVVTFKTTDSDGQEVCEDSLHEARKIASAALACRLQGEKS